MEDTWANRDLAVLEAVVAVCDEEPGRWVLTEKVAEKSGMGTDKVQQALFALRREQPPYFEPMVDQRLAGPDTIAAVRDPSAGARRAVGSWPTAEALADRLVVAMESAAEQEEDAERKGWLRKTAGYLGGAGRDLAVDVMGSAISRQMGGV